MVPIWVINMTIHKQQNATVPEITSSIRTVMIVV